MAPAGESRAAVRGRVAGQGRRQRGLREADRTIVACDWLCAPRLDEGPWPTTPAAERGDPLLRVADLLVRDKEALARAESLDTGKRLAEHQLEAAASADPPAGSPAND